MRRSRNSARSSGRRASTHAASIYSNRPERPNLDRRLSRSPSRHRTRKWGDRMRRYRIHDTPRGLTMALAAGLVGVLLWGATQVGQQTTLRFWASMGIVAGAGLVFAIVQA